MKFLSVFVIVFIAKISAGLVDTLTESSSTTSSFSSVERFSAVIDVSRFSRLPAFNLITAASLVVNPANAALVAAQNYATVTTSYDILSKAIVNVNQALTSKLAVNVFLHLFKAKIDIFGTARFQTDSKISKGYADVLQYYVSGVTLFQNLLNKSSGVGVCATQLPNLIVDAINELNVAVYDTLYAHLKFVELVLANPNEYFIQAANALAIIKLASLNVFSQALAKLAATYPSMVVVQNAINADFDILKKATSSLTVVVRQITATMQSNAADNEMYASTQSFFNVLTDIFRSFGK